MMPAPIIQKKKLPVFKNNPTGMGLLAILFILAQKDIYLSLYLVSNKVEIDNTPIFLIS